MTERRKKEIEKTAVDLRKIADVSTFGISNIFEMVSALTHNGKKCYLIRYPLGENGILGAAIYQKGDYIIFSNSSAILSREIFTVAHEIGHIVLSHVGFDNPKLSDTMFRESDQNESEANYFAACLLMPQSKIEEFISDRLDNKDLSIWDVAQMMSSFNVSFETAAHRLVTLKIISSTEHDELINRKRDTSVSRLLRTIGVSPELCNPQKIKSVPIEFIRWVRYNYQHGLIPRETAEKMTEYLDGITIEDLDIEPQEKGDSFDIDAFFGEDE